MLIDRLRRITRRFSQSGETRRPISKAEQRKFKEMRAKHVIAQIPAIALSFARRGEHRAPIMDLLPDEFDLARDERSGERLFRGAALIVADHCEKQKLFCDMTTSLMDGFSKMVIEWLPADHPRSFENWSRRTRKKKRRAR